MENEEFEVISSYSLEQAIDDKVLVEVFKTRWPELTGGKPLVVTAAINYRFTPAGIIEVWNAYVASKKKGRRYEPFETKLDGQTIWVIEDGAAFTILFPSDY